MTAGSSGESVPATERRGANVCPLCGLWLRAGVEPRPLVGIRYCAGHDEDPRTGDDQGSNPDPEAERLRVAILDIDAHATPMGEDEDGFVSIGYLISVGSLHRALGVVGHTAPKCRDCEGHDAHDLRAANNAMWTAMQRACNQPERWNEILAAAMDRYRTREDCEHGVWEVRDGRSTCVGCGFIDTTERES